MTATLRALYVGSDDPRASALSTADLQVIRAVSGIDGLKRLQDETVDCVLVTTELADISLAHFVEKVQVDHPRTPVVLVGDDADRSPVIEALSAGATSIVDETDFDAIRTEIREVVTNERLDRAIAENERLEDAVRHVATRTAGVSDRVDVEESIYEAIMGVDLYEFAWLGEFADGTIHLHYPIEGAFDPGEIASLVGGGDPSFIERAVTSGGVETVEGTADTRSTSLQAAETDATPDPTVATDGSTINQSMASAAVPLAPAESSPNVLLLATTRNRAFDQSERELLSDFGAVASSALRSTADHHIDDETADQARRFALALAHELRSPIGIASTHLALGRENDDAESFDRVEEALARVTDSIDGILELAGNDTVDETSRRPLAADIEEAWDSLEDPDAELVVEGSIEFGGNHDLIVLALSNLFRNAIEHAGAPVTVRAGPLADGIYIEDDGPGIPPADRDHVFEWGYTTLDDGTGIGLALVREIIDMHGWEISVSEGADGGARFEITGIESDMT